MTVLYFLICSAILALSVNFVHRAWYRTTAGALYICGHLALSCHAFMNPDAIDSVYFKFDALATLLNGLLSVILVPVFMHTSLYLDRHVKSPAMKGRFLSLMMLLASALSGIYFTDNFVVMWVCLEVSTVTVTFLIFHERYTDALEAAWKYLFISSFGVTLAFVGILFLSVQGHEGTQVSLSITHLNGIAQKLDPQFLKVAFILLLTGYSIKMNIFPLYAAAIDAKTAAPFPVNALTSTALINGGFIAIARIYAIISKTDSALWAQHVLLIVGLASLSIAAFQLFKVKRFKRLFAFSSMEHMALVAIALSLGKAGQVAALLHLTLHTLAKTGMFLSFGQIRAFYQSGWIRDTGDYMKMNGFGAIVFLLGLLTITAIPPSGLFYSELLLFKALLASHHYAVALILFFLLTVIIYLMFKYAMQLLFEPLPPGFNPENAIKNRWEPVSQLVLFLLTIYLAYFPPPFFTRLFEAALQAL